MPSNPHAFVHFFRRALAIATPALLFGSTVRAGNFPFTTSTLGARDRQPTGSKSRAGSYGGLAIRKGAFT